MGRKDVGGFPGQKKKIYEVVKTALVCIRDSLRTLRRAKGLCIHLVQVHSTFKLHQRTMKY